MKRALPVVGAVAIALTARVFGGTVGGAADQAATPQNPASAPTASTAPARSIFRGGVEFVSVDVVVTDHEKPVTDLTAKDFRIIDGGQSQQIVDFQHVSVPIAHRVIDLRAAPGPPPDVATNLPVPASARAFVFVLDDGATRAEDLVKVKRVMTQFLMDLTSHDRVAVIYIRRSDLGQDFTTDTGLLVKAVNNFNAAVGWMPDAQATRLVLANTIALLADGPETRRTIIYVSSGFGICPSPVVGIKNCTGLDADSRTGESPEFTPLGLQDVFERARRADVPIYTLDPQGLEAPSLNLVGHLEAQTPQNRMAADAAARRRQDFVRTVASNTGGLAYTNTNDLSGAVDKIVADNGQYYVLGYSPSPYAADGNFHRIEVTVPGREGLHVRGREGYVATRPLATAPSAGAELSHALSEAQPHSDLALRAFIAPVSGTAKTETAILTVEVLYPVVTGDDDVQVELVAADPDGHVVRSEPRGFHVPLGSVARQAPLTVSIDDSMELPRGRWTIIVGIHSQMLGTVGTLRLPIDAAALSAGPIAISPLIVGYANEGAPASLIANAQSIAGIVPLQPTTDRMFASSQTLRAFARVFAAKPDDLKTALKLIRGTAIVRVLSVASAPTPDVPSATDCAATVDLNGLQPGAYVLEFTAQASGKQTVTRTGISVR